MLESPTSTNKPTASESEIPTLITEHPVLDYTVNWIQPVIGLLGTAASGQREGECIVVVTWRGVVFTAATLSTFVIYAVAAML
jgi:hypothetical protein